MALKHEVLDEPERVITLDAIASCYLVDIIKLWHNGEWHYYKRLK